MTVIDEPFRAPVELASLREICDEPDDGRRNWFVTLAYWDLSRQAAAYTHALDQPERSRPRMPRGFEEYASSAMRRPTELFAAQGPLLDELNHRATSLRPVAMQSTAPATAAVADDPKWDWPAKLLAREVGPSPTPPLSTTPISRPPLLNANFCTFATWSSLTLGRDIRNVRLPRRFEFLANQHLRRTVTNFVVAARRLHGMELARLLGRGQRVVLWEVGYGLHALFTGEAVLNELPAIKALDFTCYQQERAFTDVAMNELERVISRWLALRVVPRGATGLRQLRTKDLAYGLASYHLARRAAQQAHEAVDADVSRRLWKWVAELILRGNILIGAYEQRKVDQLLDYPIEDFASEFFIERSGLEARERGGEGRWRRRLDWSVRDGLREHAPQVWSRFFTDQILVFWAGEEILRLGRDLPLPPHSTDFYPKDLAGLEDHWLRMLWRLYDHSYGEGHGTQSRIWSIFSDRMNFIVNFMRSRAQTPGLWVAPFEPWEDCLLRSGMTPRSQDDPAS